MQYDFSVQALIGLCIYVLYTPFKMWIVSKRLSIRFDWRLCGVTILSDIAVMIAGTACLSIFIPDTRVLLFMLQLLLVLGIEAPMYQIYYRTKSWNDIVGALLISRALFMLAMLVIVVTGSILASALFKF